MLAGVTVAPLHVLIIGVPAHTFASRRLGWSFPGHTFLKYWQNGAAIIAQMFLPCAGFRLASH